MKLPKNTNTVPILNPVIDFITCMEAASPNIEHAAGLQENARYCLGEELFWSSRVLSSSFPAVHQRGMTRPAIERALFSAGNARRWLRAIELGERMKDAEHRLYQLQKAKYGWPDMPPFEAPDDIPF